MPTPQPIDSATIDAALHPRPVHRAPRQRRARGLRRNPRARAPRRGAGLRALLGIRAPRLAGDCGQLARGAAGGDRRCHDDDPHRLGRRDAAALQRLQGRGKFRGALEPVPGPRGPRRWPGTGRRHERGHRARRRRSPQVRALPATAAYAHRGAVEPGLSPARGTRAGRAHPGVGAGHQPRQRAARGRTGTALRRGAVHQPAIRPAHRRGLPQPFPSLAARSPSRA